MKLSLLVGFSVVIGALSLLASPVKADCSTAAQPWYVYHDSFVLTWYCSWWGNGCLQCSSKLSSGFIGLLVSITIIVFLFAFALVLRRNPRCARCPFNVHHHDYHCQNSVYTPVVVTPQAVYPSYSPVIQQQVPIMRPVYYAAPQTY